MSSETNDTLRQTSICKRCGGTIQYAARAPHMPIVLHGRYKIHSTGQVIEMCEDVPTILKRNESIHPCPHGREIEMPPIIFEPDKPVTWDDDSEEQS